MREAPVRNVRKPREMLFTDLGGGLISQEPPWAL